MGNCNCKHGQHGPQTICAECDLPQLARNNYFTGKLLVERDFTDEQHYFMGKDRRHNQYLHGWGAVCGLKVSPHPNPACADRFVLIDPGAAIDCCGREILVRHQECFDFHTQYLSHWEAQHGPGTTPDAKPVDIQICVSYRECATEDVPSLYDDCGSGASKPNRILEAYAFDVLTKSGVSAPASGANVKWQGTLNFADAIRVARHEATKRIYVLTSTATTAVVYALDAATESIVIPPQTFAASQGLDLAVAPAGDFIYVALQPNAAGSAPTIAALKMLDLSQSNSVPAGTVTDTTLQLAVVPSDGRVISAGKQSGVLVWPTTINSSATVPVSVAIANPIALAAGAAYAYVLAAGSNQVSAIDLTNPALPVTTFPVSTAPSALALSATSTGDRLAVLDPSGTPTLFFVGLPTGPSTPTALASAKGFANPPLAVQFAPDGRWAFVLEQDAAKKIYVQAVDENAAETSAPNVLGPAIPAGAGTASETLSADGSVLYVTYDGTAALPGEIAVLSISPTDCPDLLKQAVEPCPGCDDGNCIVLATIHGYVWDSPVTAAQIDNYSDRHILASTSLLTDVVRCLLEQGPGKDGPPGPAGPAGAAGPGIDKVTVKEVPCDQPATAVITGTSPNRTLELTLPGCCNNDLTVIASISWGKNGGSPPPATSRNFILGIAFSGTVDANNLDPHSIAILIPVVTQGLTSWQETQLNIKTGNFATVGDVTSAFSPAAGFVNGVQFGPTPSGLKQIRALAGVTEFRVVVKGDFVADKNGRALDGDHLPPWLPNRKTGDGIEGGTFESWIAVQQG